MAFSINTQCAGAKHRLMNPKESQVIKYNGFNSSFVAFRYKQLSLYYQDNTVCKDSEKENMNNKSVFLLIRSSRDCLSNMGYQPVHSFLQKQV